MIKLVYPKFWSNKNLFSTILIPISWIYFLLGKIREIFVKPIKFNAKVICVGNVTVGGAGKTQIVELLAKHYAKQNKKLLIVTKGYRSKLKGAKLVNDNDDAEDIGDESKILARYAPVVATKKIKFAKSIIDKIEPEIIIFDDGFQNPGFIKDCSLLVIDTTRPLSNQRLFPSGPMRETIDSAVKRCSAIIAIGQQNCNINIQNSSKNYCKPIFKANINLVSNLKRKNYIAFTAIGNPDKFYDLLTNNGICLINKKSFPDHHFFTKEEISELKIIAKNNNSHLITTTKDYVKIKNNDGIDCAVVDIALENKLNFIKFLNETLY